VEAKSTVRSRLTLVRFCMRLLHFLDYFLGESRSSIGYMVTHAVAVLLTISLVLSGLWWSELWVTRYILPRSCMMTCTSILWCY
jgi:hypothetical protein